jgi:hypothetical protein
MLAVTCGRQSNVSSCPLFSIRQCHGQIKWVACPAILGYEQGFAFLLCGGIFDKVQHPGVPAARVLWLLISTPHEIVVKLLLRKWKLAAGL